MDAEISEQPCDTRFFHREDWRSFWLTTALVFAVYLFTLAPDVTLEHSGIYSTGAMYGAMGPPPGYPLWTIYGWFFTKLLPLGNMAWRLAISSAVAGSFTCGVIALMVSRCGAMLVQIIASATPLRSNEERSLRIVCGCVSGAAFGFSNHIWYLSVVVDVWPLSMLLFCVTLCLLMRWFWVPERMRYFHAAILFYGLTLTNSQLLAAAALGIQIIIAIGKPALGRDVFFSTAVLLILFLVAGAIGVLPDIFVRVTPVDSKWLIATAIITGLAGIALAIKTRRIFTEWHHVLLAGLLFFAGLSLYFYIVVSSMTNPPVNWGYPRTVEGFFHVLSRGQFERMYPTNSLSRFAQQIVIYAELAADNFGVINLLSAVIPFCFLHKMQPIVRRWIFALFAAYLSLALILIVVLNPPPDRLSLGLVSFYLSASYLPLAILAGCGLVLLGTGLARRQDFCQKPEVA